MDWNLAFSVILSGIVIVFIALLLLILSVWIIGKIMGTANKPKPQAPVAPAPAPSAPKAESPVIKAERGIPGEVIAAISAAVSTMMGGSEKEYRIRSVKRAREARPVWGLAGMMKNTRPF